MPRKTKEETELTRRRILDVALEVFAEKGYSSTSLHEIAVRAGYTRGAVYWHFKNKADLFTALSEDIESDVFGAFEDVSINTLDDLKRTLCDCLLRFEDDERVGTFYRVAEYRTEWVEELMPLLERNRKDLRDSAVWMTAALRHLRKLEQIDPSCDPKKDGFALFVHFMGLLTIWLTDPNMLSMARDAPEHIERFLESLAPRTPPQT